ncbi:uncharacterized protein PITG_15621 [Phytophthora infestans T30-4]|uniref:RAD50-interacting protein 1 n=1 Tax=Phytophthora infestans (strain T30-4) TaxID=403677 RepID=D0NT73_PHYIT|nr:uncharacterized protein PITG_15621 [Phytophthora infestans T30-4]EEY64829.1 conserved hypothetical protein [Phytophthora infestans T30-4]|eukprot:XP_002897756.1 conserved hypothetical protein [Phytophthora infestans T30-4]
MLPASPLSTLSATLLAAVHSDASDQELQDVDWTVVSSELEALRLRTQEELAELGTALDLVEAPDRINTIEEHDEVLAVHTELKSLQPQLTLAEQHFLQLERIVRPGLTKLQTLHSRAKYLEAAVQVEKLSHEAKTQAVQATPDALEAFKTFATFAASIPDEFSVIKREAARRVEDLSVDLRQFAVEKLQLALEKIGWPEPLKTQQDFAKKETELHDVSKAFAYLLTLQLSQQPRSLAATTALWAMDCVLDPLLLRFRYHFERPESATNRLAKPEWYLSHVHEQTNAHTRLLAHALTPELHRHREEIHCWDAQILVLRGLVEAACRKLTRDLPTLLAHPPLLCHTLDEVLLFEQNIDEDIGYGSWANTDRRGYPRVIDVFTSSSDVLFAWTSADVEYAHRQDLAPPVTLRFVALLDFLSQRFMLMETEEHRYLYVMQVHLPLLHRFGQVCDARGRQLISALSKNMQSSWGELFVVVNALQHVAQTLAAWEQSSVFLELSRKVARSETTRAQVLRMHVAYSKQVLARASAAVLATEEATAVRRALAGPGAMIGPTAALTAAYSVGSKTVKSLFRHQDDPETLVFSHTLFERQIAELKALASTLLEGGTNTLVRAVERDVETYRSSPFWTETYDDDADENQVQIMRGVSCELASCYTSVSNVLLCARKLLVSEYWPALWKPLASALDDALFDAFYNPRQFAQDIKALVAVFSAGSSKTLPRSYFRLTREVCHLLEMPASRLLDQLTTILEACGVFSLTPAQVVWICTTRLDVDARETSTSVA